MIDGLEEILTSGTKLLIIDDCLPGFKIKSAANICMLDPYGQNRTEMVRNIITTKMEYMPVIGTSIKYHPANRRTAYEGIKLLLELSGHYADTQNFILISFERKCDLQRGEFGYVFEASNINLVSYERLLNIGNHGNA